MKPKISQKDPVKVFKELSSDKKNVCFLHGHTKDGFKSILAWNPKEKFISKSPNNLKKFKTFISKNIQKGRKIIGYISYDLGYELYKIKKSAKNDLKLPDIYFLAFDNWITFKKKKNSQKNKKKSSTKINFKNFKSIITKQQYKKSFDKIKHHIKKGDIYQINLTHRLEAETKIPSRELFIKIIKTNPVDFLAYIEGDGFEVLSGSPERFIKVKNRKIETCPIKGTRPRGKTTKEDINQKKELIENKKEAAELNMITDLLRNDLGKVCKIGSVKVEGHRLLSKCPTVWHTYSKITGEIAKNLSPVDALLSMLPGGSITGCPKKRAMEIIDEIEPATRSVYTGVIGHIDPNQNMDFNIAIRTVIKKSDKLYLQVGGGIVIDSENKAEYEETMHKAASFMKILE